MTKKKLYIAPVADYTNVEEDGNLLDASFSTQTEEGSTVPSMPTKAKDNGGFRTSPWDD